MSLDLNEAHKSEGPLRGLKVSVSISGPLNPSPWGYGKKEVNDFVLSLSESLIVHGAEVAFGHDWREEGVMMTLYKLAEAHDAVLAREQDRKKAGPLMTNYRFAGMKSNLEGWRAQQIEGVLNLVDCPDAPDIDAKTDFPYRMACALSVMRSQMTRETSARIALGGRDMKPGDLSSAPKGRAPGVIEEIFYSLAFRKPIYLSNLFGGVTSWAIASLRGESPKLEFQLNESLTEGYDRQGPIASLEELRSDTTYQRRLDFDALQKELASIGVEGLSAINGLSPTENEALFDTPTSVEAINRVLIGLGRFNRNELKP
ncbi:MAG: hypothetical protein ACYS8Z_14100 [Planctomycetota bacterium]|jgi:hypothetical protein